MKSGQEYDFDFDHQFIETEKHDSSYQLWKFTLQQRFLDAVNLNFISEKSYACVLRMNGSKKNIW